MRRAGLNFKSSTYVPSRTSRKIRLRNLRAHRPRCHARARGSLRKIEVRWRKSQRQRQFKKKEKKTDFVVAGDEAGSSLKKLDHLA